MLPTRSTHPAPRLIDQSTPVWETSSDNIGLRAAYASSYLIMVQADVLVTLQGWNQRLLAPLRIFPDLYAVSARTAHNVADGRGSHLARGAPRLCAPATQETRAEEGTVLQRSRVLLTPCCWCPRCPLPGQEPETFNASSTRMVEEEPTEEFLKARGTSSQLHQQPRTSRSLPHITPSAHKRPPCRRRRRRPQEELKFIHIRDTVNRGPLALRANLVRAQPSFRPPPRHSRPATRRRSEGLRQAP